MKTLVLFSLIVTPYFALAWGDLGHRTVAEIAEIKLANDTHTMGAIRSILGVEPMSIASVWPDEVRDYDHFDSFKPFHFVTIHKDHNKHDSKSALTALKDFPKIIVSATTSPQEKAIALRYIIHILGDIHQPLHVGNGFDRGGNFCLVHFYPPKSEKSKPTNLHKIWDTTLVSQLSADMKTAARSQKWFGHKELAQSLMGLGLHQFQSNNARSALGTPESWVKEAADMRRRFSYPDGDINPLQRIYCKKSYEDSIPPAAIPTLDQAYISRAKFLVQNQLVLAGIRLSHFLKDMLKDYSYEVKSQEEILQTFEPLSLPQ